MFVEKMREIIDDVDESFYFNEYMFKILQEIGKQKKIQKERVDKEVLKQLKLVEYYIKMEHN